MISSLILLNLYVLIAFKPKICKLYCPNVRLECDILEYISCTKYLGFTFNMNSQDDDDMAHWLQMMFPAVLNTRSLAHKSLV